MFKRLELVGFKSFADKTAFDFAPGITAIVGPNGSGKSNIIDSVRWVLGEQSAKSLRGGEMADVIFNGSTTRRSLGLAEVSMILDNSKRKLPVDADEVQVTRRVYRSGEGEYLINNQLSRLRDVKDLFLGTGAGSHTYCIIEQGRVDVLLQASNKERRTIFEEAAGISRFKARKIETLRKLEKVDLNLQQMKLVLDEVNKQLRSVKLQAAKAERWKEYSTRLKELRVALGLHDWRHLTEKLQAETAVLDVLKAELAQRTGQVTTWDADMQRCDEALGGLDTGVHEQEGRLAQARQQIAASETTLTHERDLAAELEKDLANRRSTLTDLNTRTATLLAAVAEAARDCGAVEADCHKQRQLVVGMEDAAQGVIVRVAVLQRQVTADKAEQFELMRRSAHLQNEVVSRQAHLNNLQRERDRLRQRGDQAATHLASLDVELQSLTDAERQLAERLGSTRSSLADRQQQRDRFRQLCEAAVTLVADLRARRSGLASRIEVLDGLERTHEGLDAGVREVFKLLEQPQRGAWNAVIGMVADFLTVPREHAALIDLALADTAQRFLVRDMTGLETALRERQQPFSSRVAFMPVRPPVPAALPDQVSAVLAELDGTGVRAADLVRCEAPELAGLPEQLLAGTVVVPDLATAHATAAQFPGVRFITRQGELLDVNGTLTVGAYHAGAGLLSRKSELRELREQAAALDERISSTEQDVTGLRNHQAALEGEAAHLQEEIDVLSEQAADLRSRVGQHQERRAGLHLEVETSRSEITGVEQELTALAESCQQAQAQVEQAETNVRAVQARLEQADRELREKEVQREQQQAERETAKVALAQVEERLKALRAKHNQIDADLAQRRQERAQCEARLTSARARLEESQRTMLQAQADLARWYLDKESAQRQTAALSRERETYRRQRQTLAQQLQEAQTTWRSQQEEAHTRELEASNLAHKRDAIAARLREDYQLELRELFEQQQATAEGQEPAEGVTAALNLEEANNEIEELRRKLSRLGNVNMEALQELVDLETRSKELQTQFDDLTASHKSLMEIINQINNDSRKQFADTFQTIRGHFQELFRKLFGGGMADVVLEDENDILECGIEIIARPPGKELRSISLMSGGEKTMTAVALLLAIFRTRPSPFCILDEVDAALDEANIGRFAAVLREFLDLSQFILITHSKRTMAMADVLYGVTMQESGISKRVAVRFDDWPNEGKNGTADHGNKPESFAGR